MLADIPLRTLIEEVKEGDTYAFTELVRRYQNLAFGYAYAILGDFHLAQDAAQEAFVAAYAHLEKLQEPEAFPGWLRGIVRHQCGRILRKRQLHLVPIEDAGDVETNMAGPEEHWERRDRAAEVTRAIETLPQTQREVVTLYYIKEYSQQEVATFLDLPLSVVNNRLHAARKQLKRRMLPMVKDTLNEHALPEDFARRLGRIVEVRGPVIDVRFAPDKLPAILSALTLSDAPGNVEVTVEVAQHLGDGVVRCIAASPAARLMPGMDLVNTRAPVAAPLDQAAIRRAVQVLGGTREGSEQAAGAHEILETGIKAIDLLCPFRKGGKVAVLGGMGVGKLVVIEEVVHNVAHEHGVSLFTFIQPGHEAAFVREQMAWTPPAGSAQTIVLPAGDPFDLGAALESFDAITYMSRDRAKAQLWPAIDPVRSTSRLLDPAIAGQEHYNVARSVREIVTRGAEIEQKDDSALSDDERLIAARARKIQRFLTQYFFVAEEYTKHPGQYVSREQTVAGFKAILAGDYDDVPEDAFLFRGSIEEVRGRGR